MTFLSSTLISTHELLELAEAIFWTFGYAALLQKLRKERSTTGLSLQTLLALVIGQAGNFAAIIASARGNYVPFRLLRFVSATIKLSVALFAFFVVLRKYRLTYESEQDSFGVHLLNFCCMKFSVLRNDFAQYTSRVFFRPHWLTLYGCAAGAAVILEVLRSSTVPFSLGLLECFTDVLLTLAFLPQLHMFWNSKTRMVNELLGRFVMWLLASKLVSVIYWITDAAVYHVHYSGRGIHIGSEIANVLVLSEFTYYYFKSKRQGYHAIILPV